MISDEELLAVYWKAIDAAIAGKIENVHGTRLIGLRAVAALAAQRQRDMEPTADMITAASDVRFRKAMTGREYRRLEFIAMQRAAPLVTDREDGNG